MNCFYLIDKPVWISSFCVIRELRKKLNIKRIWHTWTLDPLASGLLIVAVWNYTKLIPYLEDDTKEYNFKVMLDWISPSYDLGTQVDFISQEKQDFFKQTIKKSFLEQTLKKYFLWEIYQVPPKYSALKINWKKAFEKVRDSEEFELKKRKVNIFDIELLDFSYPEVYIRAHVSSWTYIRTIAFDLWNILWTWGYVSYLRRTKIWDIGEDLSDKLENFDENNKLKDSLIFDKSKYISLDEDEISLINNWQIIKSKYPLMKEGNYYVYNWSQITNVVSFESWFLKQKRRII